MVPYDLQKTGILHILPNPPASPSANPLARDGQQVPVPRQGLPHMEPSAHIFMALRVFSGCKLKTSEDSLGDCGEFFCLGLCSYTSGLQGHLMTSWSPSLPESHLAV